jgi:hypothetical protein
MTKILALALAAAVSLGGVTAGFAKAKHHHHARMTVKNVANPTPAPSEFGNNPTPTRNDPPGTRTNCRGGCQ